MDRDEALGISRKVVALSRSDDVLATVRGQRQGATRFANSAITQNVAERQVRLSIRVAFGRRRGEVVVNRFDDESLAAAVKRAEAIAEVAPEDEEHLPPVGPSTYPEVPGAAAGTADLGPAERARGVKGAVEAAGDGGARVAGAYTTTGTFAGFANSAGAEGYHEGSSASIHVTTVTGSSSGWADRVSRDGADVDPAEVGRRSGELARLAEDPGEVEPGEYDVVLAPAAVSELLAFYLFSAQAKPADEGRSALSGKEGERIGSEKVTVRSVLADPAVPGVPFDGEGLPNRDVTWIEKGVLTSYITSRYWAEHTGRPHTPYPGTVTMEGGDKTAEELIAGLDRGLYVTRFWYTRFVDPMTLLLTGMTRDALFLVEGGKITGGVKHLRYNDSPLRVFQNVVEAGRPEPAQMYLRGRIPPLLVKGFRFTSGTSF